MRSDAAEFLALADEFEDLIAPETILIKEVYAHFGLLFYAFGLVEHTLINAVHLNRLYQLFVQKKLTSADEWTSAYDEIGPRVESLTFGNLAKEVIAIQEFSDLSDRLGLAKKNRDYFAHRFFREAASIYVSDEGCRLLLVRISKTRKVVDDLDGDLSTRYRMTLHRMRMPEIDEARLAEISRDLLQEGKSVISSKNPSLGWLP